MYYPYFRGKQYELITIREMASKNDAFGFIPIIEPVKEQVGGLKKTIDVLCEEKKEGILITNPSIGDHKGNFTDIDGLTQNYIENENINIGLLLTEKMTTSKVIDLIQKYPKQKIVLIHSGFSEAKILAENIRNNDFINTSIFIEDHCGKLYRKHFRYHTNRILMRDGFQKRKNKDHPNTEFFSDLHVTYTEENATGFGDFLMVGDDYSESGGPAYTIAIHLTYIDHDKDDEMHIKHFKSDRQDTPQDPAGKFAEALKKLIRFLDSADNKFFETNAIKEFKDLHQRGHFPGLGYVKKLSMKHHIETLDTYIKKSEIA